MKPDKVISDFHRFRKRLARERCLVERICKLTDNEQLKMLAYIEHLGMVEER